MAERLKDAADLKLESLFRSEPAEDDGFSINVMKRVRRQMWVQRLSLPVAIVLGVLIAAKPLAQLVSAISNLLTAVPTNIGSNVSLQGLLPEIAIGSVPQMTTIMLGLTLLGAILMLTKMLEE